MKSHRRYRCFFSHAFGIFDTGVLPFIQLHASRPEEAARLAQWVTGCKTVVEVQRLEDAS